MQILKERSLPSFSSQVIMQRFDVLIVHYLVKSSPCWNTVNYIRTRIQIDYFLEDEQAHLNWV